MRRIKLLLTSAGALALVLPLFVGVAQAANTQTPLRCPTVDGEFTNFNYDNCDILVDKQVSVNGGAYVEADTAGAAASAVVGDTVTWKVTLTNTSLSPLTPTGAVFVHDLLPSGVSYVSSSATAGVYHSDDGTYNANLWYAPVGLGLPATLTITTTASTVGLQHNNAALAYYDPGSCDGGRCVYGDNDSSNDSNDAYVDIQTKPAEQGHVLGDSTTLAATGQGTTGSMLGGTTIIASAIGLAAVTRRYRAYKLR